MTQHFRTFVVTDFEYECANGNLPDVVCMEAHVLDERLQHVRTIQRGVASLVLRHRLISGLIPSSLLIRRGRNLPVL